MTPFFNLFSDDIWLFAVRPIDPDRLSDFKSVGVRRGSPFDRPDRQYGLSVSPFNDWPYVAAMLGSRHLDGILAARAVILENVAGKSPLQGEAQFHVVLGTLTGSIIRATDAPSSASVTARFREGLEKAIKGRLVYRPGQVIRPAPLKDGAVHPIHLSTS